MSFNPRDRSAQSMKPGENLKDGYFPRRCTRRSGFFYSLVWVL